jgi:hypothetical protein
VNEHRFSIAGEPCDYARGYEDGQIEARADLAARLRHALLQLPVRAGANGAGYVDMALVLAAIEEAKRE